VKTANLPPAYARRLSGIRHSLENRYGHHGEFGGKRLSFNRLLISIPLGRRWRAIFEMTVNGYKFRDCLSHENYNHIKQI